MRISGSLIFRACAEKIMGVVPRTWPWAYARVEARGETYVRIMSWHNGDPGTTPEQEERLEHLKLAVSDIEELKDKDDYYFLRWLRIRNFNVREARCMIIKHLEVRKRLNVDTLLTGYTPPEVLQKYFPGGFFGEDREGHPVWYDNYGSLDLRGLYHSVKEEQFLKHKCYQGELCEHLCQQASLKTGRHIETFVMIIDLENISCQRHLYRPGIRLMRDVIAMLDPNYPDRCGKVFLINVPSVFPLAYSIVKPFIDEKTDKIISVISGDYREELQKYISPDQLPQAYGGTRCEPDPYCTKYINQGGVVPKEHYLSNLMEIDKDEMERVVIGPRSSHLVKYDIDTPGTVVCWEFMSTSHDIKYGWTLEVEEEKNPVEIIPVKRVNSHIKPVNGSFTCDRTGKYILKFDNSYSWTRPKEVFYSVKMLLPDDIDYSEAPPTEQEVTPTGQEVLPTEQEAPPIEQEVTLTRQEVTSTEQEAPPTEQEVTPTRQEVTPTEQEAPPTEQEIFQSE